MRARSMFKAGEHDVLWPGQSACVVITRTYSRIFYRPCATHYSSHRRRLSRVECIYSEGAACRWIM